MIHVQGQRSRSRGQSVRSQRNVTYKQEKRSKTATDRLSEFKLGMGDEIKADRDALKFVFAYTNNFSSS